MSNLAHTLRQPRFAVSRFLDRITERVIALELAWQIRRERNALHALGDRALRDLGLSRADIHAESARSFWDVPVDRLRML